MPSSVDVTTDGAPRHHQVGGRQGAMPSKDPEQVADDGEGRVRDDAHRTTGPAEVPDVHTQHAHAWLVRQGRAQSGRPSGMELDRDHPRARGEERVRQSSLAGADVHDQFTPADARRGHHALGPVRREAMPSPRRPVDRFRRTGPPPGHGGP